MQRVPQSPVPGYYPAVIDEEMFIQVQALLSQRSRTRDKAARHNSKNMFGAVARCNQCGARMAYRSARRNRHGSLIAARLRCTGSQYNDCTCPSMYYFALEEAFWAAVPTLVDVAPAAAPDPEDVAALAQLEKEIAGLQAKAENLVTSLDGRGAMPTLVRRLTAVEEDITAKQQDLDQTRGRIAVATNEQRWRELNQLEAIARERSLGNKSAEPAQVKFLIDRLFSKILVDVVNCEARFYWRGGEEFDLYFPSGIEIRRASYARRAEQAKQTRQG